MSSDMTQEEKQKLIDSIAELCMRDVLKRDDMLEILEICRDACERRIEKIEDIVRPSGPVQ